MRGITFVSFVCLPVLALAAETKPTFSKDVAPIVFNRCVECHRSGEAAPMAFTSYAEIRPWAKAIKAAVLSKKMPPWLADPAHGSFKNDRRLSAAEVNTITAWVDSGAPEGNAKDLPPVPKFEMGWSIGKPDQVFDIGRDYEVPAEGVVAYQYFTVPSGFTEDKWVEAAEIRPDARSVVHHVIVFVRAPNAPQTGRGGGSGNLLVGFAPGDPPMRLEPGTAKLVPAGSTFSIQMHYTPNGKAQKDRSYFGLRYAKQPIKYRAHTANALNFGFRIPPGDPAHEVKSSWTAREDVLLSSLMPHMHVRGKDFKYTVVFPDGREQVLLQVPKYDFNWQLAYELKERLLLPKGTRIDCVAHFDNSANNPHNPDPTKEVRWGDQTWEEMMIGWFNYVVPVDTAKAAPSTAGIE